MGMIIENKYNNNMDIFKNLNMLFTTEISATSFTPSEFILIVFGNHVRGSNTPCIVYKKPNDYAGTYTYKLSKIGSADYSEDTSCSGYSYSNYIYRFHVVLGSNKITLTNLNSGDSYTLEYGQSASIRMSNSTVFPGIFLVLY